MDNGLSMAQMDQNINEIYVGISRKTPDFAGRENMPKVLNKNNIIDRISGRSDCLHYQ